MRTYCRLLRDDRFQRLALLDLLRCLLQISGRDGVSNVHCNAVSWRRPCDQLAQRGSLRKYFPSVFWNTNGFLPHNYAYLLIHIARYHSETTMECWANGVSSTGPPAQFFIACIKKTKKKNKLKSSLGSQTLSILLRVCLARYNRAPYFDNLQQ